MSEAAKEYGAALYSLAQDEHLEDRFLDELRQLQWLLSQNPEYLVALASPNIPKSERVSMLREAFVGNFHSYVVNFLCLLTESGHANVLIGCIEEYRVLYNTAHNILTVQVLSATELSDAQKEALRFKLEKITGHRLEFQYRIDRSLIAGMRVSLDGKLYDDTVRSKLDSLRRTLSSITV